MEKNQSLANGGSPCPQESMCMKETCGDLDKKADQVHEFAFDPIGVGKIFKGLPDLSFRIVNQSINLIWQIKLVMTCHVD